MPTEVEVATPAVDIEKLALDEPAGMVTVGALGNACVGSLLVSETTAPPAGATPPRVTVPCADAPPITDAGLTEASASSGGLPCVSRRTVIVEAFSRRRSLDPLASTSADIRLALPTAVRSTGTVASCAFAPVMTNSLAGDVSQIARSVRPSPLK